MSTTLEQSASSEHYVEFDEYVDYQLRKTRANIRTTELLTAVCGVAVFCLAYLLVFVVLDHWVVPGGFSPWMRSVMLGAVVVVSLVWCVWRVLIPYSRRISTLYAARAIENASPELKSSLLNLIDVQKSGRLIPEQVRRAMEKYAAVRLSKAEVDEAVDRRPLMRLSYALLFVVVALCLYTLFSPKRISSSIWRALLPAAEIAAPTETRFADVKPGDVKVLARTQLEVTAELGGEIPEKVTLYYTTADRRYVDQPVEMRPTDDGIHEYRAVLTGENGRGILQKFQYRLEAGDARTRDFTVTVIQPPSAELKQLRLTFPEYMRLDPLTQSAGSLDTWEGAKVALLAEANQPLRAAYVRFTDTEDIEQKAEEVRMDIQGGTQLRAEWTLQRRSDGSYPKFYHLYVENEFGEVNLQPTLFPMRIRPDQPPEVTLLDPVRDLEMPSNGVVPMLVTARDPDFRLRRLNLQIEKEGESIGTVVLIETDEQSVTVNYDWRLSSLSLLPGEVVTFWIEVLDNRQPLSNRKNSPRLKIRITDPVSPEEAKKQLEDEKSRQQAQQKPSDDKGEAGDQSGDSQAAADGNDPQANPPAGDSSNADPKSADKKPGEGDPNKNDDGQQGDQRSQKLRNDGSDDGDALQRLYKLQQKKEGEEKEQGGDQPQPGSEGQPDDQKGKQPKQSPSDKSDDGPSPPDKSPKGRTPGDKDAGKEGTGESGETGNSKGGQSDTKRGGGSPTDDNSPEPPAGKGPAEKPSDKPGGSDSNSKEGTPPENGTRTPTNDSEGATKQKNNGEPVDGQGKPETDPNVKPEPANGNIERKPGEKPSTRPSDGRDKPSRTEQGDPSDPDSPRQTRDGEPGKPNSDQKSPAGDKSTQPQQDGQPAGSQTRPMRSGDNPAPPPAGDSKPAGNPPNATDQKSGESNTSKSGNSDQTASGGDSKENGPAGDAKGGKEGEAGSSSAKPDSKPKPADAPPGKPMGESADGKGDEKSDSGKQDGGQGKSGGNESKEGGNGAGNSPDGKSGGSSPTKPTGGTSPTAGPGGKPSREGGGVLDGAGPSGGKADGSSGGPGGPAGNAPEEANLEFAREAANLVLDKLQSQLERGEVEPELLKELGWTEEDVQKFTERLKGQLATDKQAETPEEMARRRQFEEMLKSLDFSGRTERRQSSQRAGDDVGGVGPRKIPVPPQYRELYEAYTRSLSKRSATPAPPTRD